MTLKTRLALFFVLNTLIGLSLFSATYFIVERRAVVRQQALEQEKMLDKTAAACRTIPTNSSPLTALNFFAVLLRENGALAAACADNGGKILAHSDSSKIGRGLNDPSVFPAAGEELRGPFAVGDKPLGVAVLVYDKAALARELDSRLRESLRQPALVAALTFVFSLLFSFVLAWSLSGPIEQLMHASRAIGRGELDYRSPIAQRSDELGKLAKEMNSMADQLKLIDEMKDEFISYVSHDLRNPMAAMTMYVDDILGDDGARKSLSAKHRDLLGMIKENATRLNLFIANVLGAAKRKAGKLEYHLQPISVEDSLANAKALFDIVANAAGVEIKLDVAAELPKILADPEHFEHIVMNLLSNAIKFTDEGGSVALSARRADGRVRVSVADTGKGIAKESLPLLFQRFSQVDAKEQRTKGIRGSGLGLRLVKETAEAMGGRVSVHSELGHGSTFSVELPIEPKEAA